MGKTKRLQIEREDWKPEGREPRIHYPLYENEYLTGMKSIFHMILEWENRRREEADRMIPDEKRNIISIIGRRGSGKTTVMNEFCQILRSFGEEEEQKRWWLKHTVEQEEWETLSAQKFRFRVLPAIDASLLGDKEDLFMLILVSIYRELEGELRRNSQRDSDYGRMKAWQREGIAQAAEKIQQIFHMYTNLQTTAVDARNSLDFMMDFLTRGYDVQKEIAAFIDQVTELSGSKSEEEYFVIAIDDLDLNTGHGYEMLEQLQKYFSYEKIIILITIDYQQIELLCQKHFYREMKDAAAGGAYIRHVQELTNDYLTKIFHYSQRIYTPDIGKLGRRLQVVIPLADGQEEKPEKKSSIKEFVMRKIAETMNIFYDGCGLKRHFCEPGTVRELVSYNEFLDLLIPIDYEGMVWIGKIEQGTEENRKRGMEESNKERLKDYDKNHERFNEDILMRLVHNTLTTRQRSFFEKLIQRDLERRAMYFVGAEHDGTAEEIIRIQEMGQENYSYGDLLEKIYEWGRECFDDKPLISCVLASFTSEMVREYMGFRYQPDEKRRKTYQRRLVQFLGQHFNNDWTAEAFSKMNFPQSSSPKGNQVGYLKVKNRGMGTILIPMSMGKSAELSKADWKTRQGREKWKRALKKWLTEEAVLETVETLDMFCMKREEDSYCGVNFCFQMEKSGVDVHPERAGLDPEFQDAAKAGTVPPALRISIEEEMTWDIMSFVGKSLTYAEERERWEKNITEGLEDVLAQYFSLEKGTVERKGLKSILKEILQEQSRFGRFMKEEFEQEAAFPFYDLDLTYNIWKRVRREQAGTPLPAEEFVTGVKTVFDRVKKCLAEERKFYGEDSRFNYEELFENCPYVKALYDMDKETGKTVSQRLMRALYHVLFLEVGVRNRPAETETMG
ncbi:MAG: P-loop NTPase fold protein [bacterium]|nr:P-loop NTPase fold protein [bacterium]